MRMLEDKKVSSAELMMEEDEEQSGAGDLLQTASVGC